ncbi:sensor domain-containing protein [Metabacillus sp. HB246100]|uniref:sensor domain-containing protein n=1 Tax=Bacillus weihaiensis TaxID=1547283 RepID=UPI0023578A5C|nr:EAL domain-containing protein [Bacillus weihaiensis]
MKYTWRITLTVVLLVVNFIIFSQLNLEKYIIQVIVVNLANVCIGWIIGFQLDKYIHSRKEFGLTQKTLLDYAFALESVPIGIGITNDKGQFEYVNKSHQNLYGYSAEELLNMTWRQCYSKDNLENLETSIPLLLKDGKWKGETIGIRKDGSTFPQEIHLSIIEGTNKVICVVRDISEQQQYLANIKYVAEHDVLTNLPNRRKLLVDLSENKKGSVDSSILYIDLDRFKMVNDTLGHKYGDELLVMVAKRLLSIQNEYVRVYHLGGDEFIVLIQNGYHDYIENMAIELISLFKEPYLIFGKNVMITASIGICRYSEDTTNYDELIKLADTAMLHAKMDGKNTYKFFNNELKIRLERESVIEHALRKAIANHEFFIQYQPKWNLVDSSLVGFEALIRWKNPSLGMVSPAEFIPIAEDTGLITDIGNWIIDHVLCQMSKWRSKGLPLVKVSVNVSQRQFKDNKLVSYIEKCLGDHRIDAELLEIEITESLIADFNLIIPQLHALRDRGVGISIDDFGTGYSSLNFINDLPIDTLKIDQSFIRGLVDNEKNSLLVKAIIDIGNTLKLTIVAEGIETEEQLTKLVELNCTLGQGYLLGKPLGVLEVESYLDRASSSF